MKVLVDTHCWLWWVGDRSHLGSNALSVLTSLDNECFLSVASIWEMAIKAGLGKLKLPIPVQEYVPKRMLDTAMQELPVSSVHALHVASLPFHHRDPFDRLLIAQAQVEGLPLRPLTGLPEPTMYRSFGRIGETGRTLPVGDISPTPAQADA